MINEIHSESQQRWWTRIFPATIGVAALLLLELVSGFAIGGGVTIFEWEVVNRQDNTTDYWSSVVKHSYLLGTLAIIVFGSWLFRRRRES